MSSLIYGYSNFFRPGLPCGTASRHACVYVSFNYHVQDEDLLHACAAALRSWCRLFILASDFQTSISFKRKIQFKLPFHIRASRGQRFQIRSNLHTFWRLLETLLSFIVWNLVRATNKIQLFCVYDQQRNFLKITSLKLVETGHFLMQKGKFHHWNLKHFEGFSFYCASCVIELLCESWGKTSEWQYLTGARPYAFLCS